MARNAEKAQSTLSRWLAMQKGESGQLRKRPKLASYCKTVRQCTKWRQQIFNEIANLVTLIQNESLEEYKIREMNDEINKLIREKYHWEKRIIELGGPDYIKSAPSIDEESVVVGQGGYQYFGAAKNLPDVKELLKPAVKSVEERDRKSLYKCVDSEYYGFNDDHELLEAERVADSTNLELALEAWKQDQRDKDLDPEAILQSIASLDFSALNLDNPLSSLVKVVTKDQLNAVILQKKKECLTCPIHSQWQQNEYVIQLAILLCALHQIFVMSRKINELDVHIYVYTVRASTVSPCLGKVGHLAYYTVQFTDFLVSSDSFEELLSLYYECIFPVNLLHKWLSYSGDASDGDYFACREFAYTINTGYIRYKSYNTPEAFKKDLIFLNPQKVHIGAVYNVPPKEHSQVAATNFLPAEKELIFDIDANDFDKVRICACRGSSSVCNICWNLMKIAIKILNYGLEQDFNFKNIIWIFSGRRGVHCWVCDPIARKMNQEERSAVASYLGQLNYDITTANVRLPLPLHPFLNHVHTQFVKPYFENLVSEHNLLDNTEMQDMAISYLNDELTQKTLKSQLAKKAYNSQQKWNLFKSKFQLLKKNTNYEANLQFYFGYPRLDIQVSKQQIHLLKAPFSVHPDTGNICVPIIDCNTFDPTNVPTLESLLKEFKISQKNSSNTLDALRATSLAPYLDFFTSFVTKIEREA